MIFSFDITGLKRCLQIFLKNEIKNTMLFMLQSGFDGEQVAKLMVQVLEWHLVEDTVNSKDTYWQQKRYSR